MCKRVFVIAMILALAMALALGGCGGAAKDDGAGGLDLMAYSEPDEGAAPEDIDIGEAGEKDSAGEEPATAEGLGIEPLFPEFDYLIIWNLIPKDYVGGFGSIAEPNESGGVVNIRDYPSLDAKVVAQLRSDSDVLWWQFYETAETDEGMFIGYYMVENDDYTWTLVESSDEKPGTMVRGWIATEVISFWGI